VRVQRVLVSCQLDSLGGRGSCHQRHAEFSFLLAIPTLGGATIFDLAKNYQTLAEAPGGLAALGIGSLVALVVAWLVIAVFLRYLKRFGLTPFGYYRIVLGVAVLLTL